MQFKPDKPNNNSEKQNLWNECSLKVEKVTDGLNYPIDLGIKETVIAFNVHGIYTDGSCEGHLDRGLPYPWIDIAITPDKSLEEFKKDQETIRKRTYKNEGAFKKDDPILYEKMMKAKEVFIKKKIEVKLEFNKLIDEFYRSRKPYSEEGEIVLKESGNGYRVEMSGGRGIGLDNWKKFDEKIEQLTQFEKENFLRNNQKEMRIFTEFLKKKFFEGK